MKNFDSTKVINSLLLVAGGKGKRMNRMKALKLIWLADRLHLRMYGRLITNDKYFALKNGPVASSTKNLLDNRVERDLVESSINLDGHFYIPKIDPDKMVFSESELEVFELILTKYGSMGEFDLSNLSHEFPEWKKFEEDLTSGRSKRFQMSIEDFFSDYDDGRGLFVDGKDDVELMKDYFNLYNSPSEIV